MVAVKIGLRSLDCEPPGPSRFPHPPLRLGSETRCHAGTLQNRDRKPIKIAAMGFTPEPGAIAICATVFALRASRQCCEKFSNRPRSTLWQEASPRPSSRARTLARSCRQRYSSSNNQTLSTRSMGAIEGIDLEKIQETTN